MTRGRRAFWALVGVAVVATGLLSRELAWRARPVAGVAVAATGSVAVIAAGLALRILLKIQPGRPPVPVPMSCNEYAGKRRGSEDHQPAR
jgi:hypothetical protein